MFVIDFEQVITPKETFNVIRHLNPQSQQQKHLEKCEICPVGIYSEENVLGEFHGGETFKEEDYCPKGNYSEITVRG